jgi:hypothetical protein
VEIGTLACRPEVSFENRGVLDWQLYDFLQKHAEWLNQQKYSLCLCCAINCNSEKKTCFQLLVVASGSFCLFKFGGRRGGIDRADRRM